MPLSDQRFGADVRPFGLFRPSTIRAAHWSHQAGADVKVGAGRPCTGAFSVYCLEVEKEHGCCQDKTLGYKRTMRPRSTAVLRQQMA